MMTDIKTLCELKSSEQILMGRLCTRDLKSISNFIINFLCVSPHLLIVLSSFLISKFKIKIQIGKICSHPQTSWWLPWIGLSYQIYSWKFSFPVFLFSSLHPLLCMVLLMVFMRVSTLRNLTTGTVSPLLQSLSTSITVAFHRPLRAWIITLTDKS